MQFVRAFLVSVALLFLFVSKALAGIGPENVAVVVNGDSWASLTVANEYGRLRGIPASNFIVLTGLSSIEITDVDRFRKEILEPVFSTLERRGIANQIDCITYSVDIPYSVNVTSDMVGKKFSMVITGMAATNGLTYLHELVEKKDTDYLRLDVNRYHRHTLPLPIGSGLTPAEGDVLAQGMSLYEQKQYAKAAETLAPLLRVQRSDPDIAYNLACCLALAGQPKQAIDALKAAVAAGWRNAFQLTADPDFRSLTEIAEFKRLVETVKGLPIAVQTGTGFRSRYAWNAVGEPGNEGPHYMLSTFLGVTSGRGNSIGEVLDSIRRSVIADGTAPKGTFYFPKNGDVRSTTRAWAFDGAAAELRKLGLNAVVENGVLPVNRTDVAGATIGTAGFDWAGSKSTILPGALVEHLTSFGGIISERMDQSPCTDFIRAGASGSSGTVTEPYALQQKFPDAFMHVHYAQGWTLAESFYQSLFGPYQLLIIGDPLCRPWSKPIPITLPGLSETKPIKGVIKITPKVSLADLTSIFSFELYVDGRLRSSAERGKPLTFDSKSVSDGIHQVGVVAVQKGPTQSRSHLVMLVRVSNQGKSVYATVIGGGQVKFGDTISIQVSSPGARSIGITHLGRTVGSITADRGTIQVPTLSLGTGGVTLQAAAHFLSSGGGGAVFGTPIQLTIGVPTAVAKPDSITPATLVNGLALSLDGGTPVTVKDTFDGNWLSNLVHSSSQHFTLSGVFDVPVTDLYQVQLKTNTDAAVMIDGVRVLGAIDDSQLLAPIDLPSGKHRLQILGIANPGATLDIRLGAAGAQHLSESRFKH